jgi:hypothetical protein
MPFTLAHLAFAAALIWARRTAVMTDHKFPQETRAREEFVKRTVRWVNGRQGEWEWAERGVRLSNGFWAREVRPLDEKGHQTAMIWTDFQRDLGAEAVALYARWRQENFFQHMGRHYG